MTSTAEQMLMTSSDRANAFHALARVFSDPRDWDAGLPDSLRDAFGPLDPRLAALADRAGDAIEATLDDREALLVAYSKLFVGPFEISAAPWASFYLDPEQRLMGPASAYAANAYAEAGIGPGGRVREAPDHITHELEFMYFLAFQEVTTGDPSWASRQARFWTEHLGRWLPQLADAVQTAGVDPVYDELACLTKRFAELESEGFEPKKPTGA